MFELLLLFAAFVALYVAWCHAMLWLVSSVDRGVPDKKRPPAEGPQRKGRIRRRSILKRMGKWAA